MKEFKRISDSALDKLPYLAKLTENFTGAEIEGLVRSAASFALARYIYIIIFILLYNKCNVII
jgi:SpoVK/Ycf46/Vps4 family AAA+-type ATPase